jgi:uncharacterized protein (TIGR02246 family)
MSNASQRKEDMIMQTPLKPPFTRETALLKVKAAEDAWNSRDPERVALAYTPDSQWRNRTEFFTGREAIKAFLRRKWAKESESTPLPANFEGRAVLDRCQGPRALLAS